MTTRTTILNAWAEAQLRADADGAVTLTSPAYAGQLLTQANGDAYDAIDLVPWDETLFLARVRGHLLEVVNEDTSDRMRGRIARERAVVVR